MRNSQRLALFLAKETGQSKDANCPDSNEGRDKRWLANVPIMAASISHFICTHSIAKSKDCAHVTPSEGPVSSRRLQSLHHALVPIDLLQMF